MEYTNDVIFNVKYNEQDDRGYFKKDKWTTRLLSKVKQNKILSILISLSIIFIIADCIMIINFINILKQL